MLFLPFWLLLCKELSYAGIHVHIHMHVTSDCILISASVHWLFGFLLGYCIISFGILLGTVIMIKKTKFQVKLHFSRKSGLRWDLNLTHICAYVELALSIFPPCMQTIGEAKPLKTMPLVSADLTTVIYNQAVQKSWFLLIENFGVPISYH